MRTRLFLRTAEFLWQEGHTAHATQAEAEDETQQMVEVYRQFAEEWMAMPVLVGPKSEGQKFPGAVYTLCIEALMQDGKALQAGTSHFLGQNFAKAFDVQFQNEEGKLRVRLGDELGRLDAADRRPDHDALGRQRPGRAAAARPDPRRHLPAGQERRRARPERSPRREKLAAELRALPRDDFFGYEPLAVKVDDDFDKQPGFRFAEWELRGVPVRVELGPKDLEKQACVVARRDRARQGRQAVRRPARRGGGAHRRTAARRSRQALFDKARAFRDANTRTADSYDEFKQMIEQPGFIWRPLGRHPRDGGQDSGRDEGDDPLHPVRPPEEKGACMVTGKPSAGRVVFARAY